MQSYSYCLAEEEQPPSGYMPVYHDAVPDASAANLPQLLLTDRYPSYAPYNGGPSTAPVPFSRWGPLYLTALLLLFIAGIGLNFATYAWLYFALEAIISGTCSVFGFTVVAGGLLLGAVIKRNVTGPCLGCDAPPTQEEADEGFPPVLHKRDNYNLTCCYRKDSCCLDCECCMKNCCCMTGSCCNYCVNMTKTRNLLAASIAFQCVNLCVTGLVSMMAVVITWGETVKIYCGSVYNYALSTDVYYCNPINGPLRSPGMYASSIGGCYYTEVDGFTACSGRTKMNLKAFVKYSQDKDNWGGYIALVSVMMAAQLAALILTSIGYHKRICF